MLKLRSAGLVGLLSIVLSAALPVSGSSNTALGWGLNSSGQLGDGTTASRGTPGVIPELGSNVTAIAGGQGFGVALRNDASVWTWGTNDHGQLGVASLGWSITQVHINVPNLDGMTQSSARNALNAVGLTLGHVSRSRAFAFFTPSEVFVTGCRLILALFLMKYPG